MKILIVGATGFIGKALVKHLCDKKYEITVITRNKSKAQRLFSTNIQILEWNFMDITTISKIISQFEIIINLAGENIASKLWTKKQKQKILTSRVQLGNLISLAIFNSKNKPQLLIQASAIGFYGCNTTNICTEKSLKGNGFLAKVSEEWEKSTEKITEYGVHRIVIRTGVVLGKDGGMLSQLIKPIKYFFGSNFGKGNNWISWIHIQDEISAIEFLLKKNQLSGIYNLVAPFPVQSNQMNKLIGKKLNRPIWLSIPKFILNLFPGNMARELLLSNQNVIPQNLLKEGFIFSFSNIKDAINDLIDY